MTQVAPLQNEIAKIWIHKNPDIDELIAVWVVKTFGGKRFLDIDSADVELVDPASVKEDYQALLAKKILCIGFGGGPFDEHPESGDDGTRVNDECAATLVARVLGVRNKPGVKEIVEYALSKDHSADTKQFELGLMVKMAFRYLPSRLTDEEQQESKRQDIMSAVWVFLDGMWQRAEKFQECILDYKTTFHDGVIEKANGKALRLTSVISANPEISKYCRSKEGGFAGVVIQRQKDGHTQIFFDHKQVDPDATAAVIKYLRIAERETKGLRKHPDHDDLIVDGAIDGAEEWYYERSKRLILNGSLTQSRPTTKLSLVQIEEIVVGALTRYYDYVARQMAS